MTEQNETNKTTAQIQPFGRLPWLIALGALLLYTITLNHWVTITSLPTVARIIGWDWHPTWLDWRPTNFAPLYFLVTLPVRILPVAWQPIALNGLSAICAALTLMLLARSVALLPHDRTRDQRVRELSETGLLNGFRTVVPQILAVLACGLQRTFWENATAATSETLDLVVFAALIWCLLEFRHSNREAWLTRFVVFYGIGVTNNWALIGFFPFFLISVIWIKGLEFFEWKFIGKLVAWFCPGLLLYLLMPAVSAAADGGSFLHVLHMQLSAQKSTLFYVPRWVPLLLAVPTLVALCFIGIRWSSFRGDTSAFGTILSDVGFSLMHLLFFASGLWLFLDIRYSPRVFFEMLPFLSFYYMAALSVGYFSGYFLFILTTEPMAVWDRRSPLMRFIAKVSLTILGIAAFAVPAWLAYSNVLGIQAAKRQTLKDYAVALTQSLPPKGAVVLSDDHSRLLMLNAAYQAQGRPVENILIETDSMVYGQYLGYLAKTYPQIQSAIGPQSNLPPVIDSLSCLRLLSLFNEKSKLPIYYLHPSFGFFFEHFYAKPHGLVQELLPYSTNQFEPPALTEAEINENMESWKKYKVGFLDSVPKSLTLATDADAVGWYCSRSASAWGVELQKVNRLNDAGVFFDFALKLNPRNHMALANQRYNRNLRDKNTQPIDIAEIIRNSLIQCRTWEGVINSDGPADEPGLQYRFGQALAAGGNLRQAYLMFQRRLALLPGDFDTQFAIAKTFADMGLPDKTLAMIRQAESKGVSPDEKAELLRVESLALVIKGSWADAETLLVDAQKQSPQDVRRVKLLVDFYRLSGVNMLRAQKADKASQQFKKALVAVDTQLALLKGMNRIGSQDEADALLSKGEIQSQLGENEDAIVTLGLLLQRKPDSAAALINRAIARLKSKKYPEARQDYLKLVKLLPSKAPAVYYGLGEIAFQTNDKKEAIKNFRTFLELTPEGSAEHKEISDRLAKLEGGR